MSVDAAEVAAFARVYDATASPAFDLALRILRDPGRAEDALELAYLDLWTEPISWVGNTRVVLDVLARVRAESMGIIAGAGS